MYYMKTADLAKTIDRHALLDFAGAKSTDTLRFEVNLFFFVPVAITSLCDVILLPTVYAAAES